MGDPGPLALVAHEPVFLRAAFAWVLYREGIGSSPGYREQPHPVGLARCFDLTGLSRPGVARVVRVAMWVATGCYVAGVALPIALPLLALWFVLRETLRNSQGAVQHSRQAIAWVLIAQSAVFLAAAIRDPSSALRVGAGSHAWSLYASQQVLVAVYLTAGILKVARRGVQWVRTAPAIAVEIAKSSEQMYHDALDRSYLERAEPLLRRILEHPHWARLALGAGLALELASPLMLYGRIPGFLGGALLLAFHRTLGHYMGLGFRSHQRLLVVFFLGVPFALAQALAWLLSATA